MTVDRRGFMGVAAGAAAAVPKALEDVAKVLAGEHAALQGVAKMAVADTTQVIADAADISPDDIKEWSRIASGDLTDADYLGWAMIGPTMVRDYDSYYGSIRSMSPAARRVFAHRQRNAISREGIIKSAVKSLLFARVGY